MNGTPLLPDNPILLAMNKSTKNISISESPLNRYLLTELGGKVIETMDIIMDTIIGVFMK